MSKVSDLFKAPGEVRAKAKYNYNEGITSYSKNPYAKNFTPTRYQNTVNSFTQIVNDDDITSLRLIDPSTKEIEMFNKTLNNRLQRFTYKNKLIDYKEITGVESITGEGLLTLKEAGYNNFYNLYKKNEFGNEQILCILAFKK